MVAKVAPLATGDSQKQSANLLTSAPNNNFEFRKLKHFLGGHFFPRIDNLKDERTRTTLFLDDGAAGGKTSQPASQPASQPTSHPARHSHED